MIMNRFMYHQRSGLIPIDGTDRVSQPAKSGYGHSSVSSGNRCRVMIKADLPGLWPMLHSDELILIMW